MKSIEVVTSDSLEEALSCDDLFLEYFNVFLSLPAFPQNLSYSRFTGTFHDLEKEVVPVAPIFPKDAISQDNGGIGSGLSAIESGGVGSKTSVYAAKEDERERVLKWARESRLPLFQETRMYRELKLCKLLLRPLDFRRGSSKIRGYSRLSMGFATTTSIVSGTGRIESPSRALTSLDNQSTAEWADVTSTKYGGISDSRPASRALSLPPNLGLGRTWSATAMYDTSATESSSTAVDEITRKELTRPKTHKQRYPITSSVSRRFNQSQTSRMNMYSDSGLGTTTFDYAQSVGTSVKTRNIATRADTLGLGSRWDSEEGYSTKTPGSRTRTAMTSSSLPADGFDTPASASNFYAAKYEGKSALRTADSPSKPHRATIVLPKSKSQAPVVRIIAGSTTENGTTTYSTSKTGGEQTDDEITYDDETNDVSDDDEYDEEMGEFLDFDDRDSSCEETETEVASIERVHSMSMQHIKERIFRTKSGMDSFLKFLSGTSGENLVEFWLDSEAFKDLLAKYDRKSSLATSSDRTEVNETEAALRLRRHRLFRNILDRHKFVLTDEAKEQIRLAHTHDGLSYHVFSRTQYDVLRRLRSYWLPRFVIHRDADPSFKQCLTSGNWDDEDMFAYNPPSNIKTIPCLPLLSFTYINLPEGAPNEETELSVQTLESATAQGVAASPARPNTSQIRSMSARSASVHFVLRALVAEADAGFPLRNYILKNENQSALNTYDFLMSLEYLTDWSAKNLQQETSNRKSITALLGAVESYSIYNAFLSKDSPHRIKLPKKISLHQLERIVKQATVPGTRQPSTVPSSIFRQVKQYSLSVLAGSLKKYKEFEVSNYYESREGRAQESSQALEKRLKSPEATTTTRKTDDSSTTVSETTTGFSKPWYTDDDSTETDSASTMYSYDMERLKQLAQSIRKKGAKKPQRSPEKKKPAKKVLKRGKTAVQFQKSSKVQFTLPDGEDSKDGGEESDQGEDVEDGGDSEEERIRRKKKKKAAQQQHPNKMNLVQIKENKLLYTFFRKYVANCESVEIQNIMQMYQLCDVILAIPMTEVERKHVISSELVRTFLHQTGPKQIAMPTERTAQFYRELPCPSDDSVQLLQDYVTPTLDQAAANFSLGFGNLLKEYKLTIRSDLGQHINKAELALRTLTLKPSSKRRKALGKHSARQAPTSEHKVLFSEALDRAKEGELPLELVHFYKYLQGFGVQEGFPLIHNDLIFYVEVNKFIASFHEDHDLVTLKRKIISIRDCFIDTQMEKSLQIDIKTGTAERLRRAMETFVNDRGRDPHVPTLFDDAQHTVFNELLPFWAGFVTAMSPSEREGKRPVLKGERMQKRRLDAFIKAKDPRVEFDLPDGQPKFDMRGIEFNFSFNSGIQWKAWSDVSSSRSSTPPLTGVIEVVKAPPTGQRRIVRRSGFTIRKLQTSRDNGMTLQPIAEKTGRKMKAKSNVTAKKTTEPAAKSIQQAHAVMYATSVS